MNFTDEDYEGINLKIPYWFYTINKDKLKPMLDTLQHFFESEALSYAHPDNQRNINELQNIESKKELVAARMKDERERKETREKYYAALLDKTIYETVLEKQSDAEQLERGIYLIKKDGTETRLSEEQLRTKKYNIAASAVKVFEEQKPDLDIFKTASSSGFHLLASRFKYYEGMRCSEVSLQNISCDVWLVKITYLIRCIKLYQRNTKGALVYTTKELLFDEEKKLYCYHSGVRAGDFIYLGDYEYKHDKFTKLKKEGITI